MALTTEAAPPEGIETVRRSLMLNASPAAVNAAGAADGAKGVEVLKPYPLYTSGLRELLAGRFLESARRTSWQYVVVIGGEPLQLAEVRGSENFAGLFSEAVVDALLDVTNAAENLSFVQEANYELRILRAPDLYLTAVWLHREGEDWLLPVRPAPARLQAGSILNEAQLVRALRPLAEARSTAAVE
jgi:hypothetical protein